MTYYVGVKLESLLKLYLSEIPEKRHALANTDGIIQPALP
jgi:hypothetical protein